MSTIDIVLKRINAAFTDTDRSSLVIKNIINSIGVKGLGILISLILIPLSINYVGAVNYGIWLTISSVIGWMNQFDFGMGNGLRNKITTEYAQKKYDDAKLYVSTTYVILMGLAAIFFLLFLVLHFFIDWTSVFNTPKEIADVVDTIVIVVLVCFCAQFVLQIITVLLTAVHLAYKGNIIQTAALVLSLVGVLYLTYFTESSLIYLVIVLAFAPIVSMFFYSIYYFSRDIKFLKPNFKVIDINKSKSLFSVGGMFFIVQLGSLVLYQSSNLIIANILGLEDVSVFNVVHKYFTALFMVITVILNPYWSAFADAFELKDYEWLSKSLKNLQKIFLGFVGLNIICVLISPYIFKLWLGDSLYVPFILTSSMGGYFIVYFWYNIHVTFIYGTGKLRMQVMSIVVASLINVPLSIFLGKTLGLHGVVLGNIIVFMFLGLITYLQVNKLLNQKAQGVWDK